MSKDYVSWYSIGNLPGCSGRCLSRRGFEPKGIPRGCCLPENFYSDGLSHLCIDTGSQVVGEIVPIREDSG